MSEETRAGNSRPALDARIEQAKHQLEHMIDLTPQTMLLMDSGGAVVRTNRSLLDLLGLDVRNREAYDDQARYGDNDPSAHQFMPFLRLELLRLELSLDFFFSDFFSSFLEEEEEEDELEDDFWLCCCVCDGGVLICG